MKTPDYLSYDRYKKKRDSNPKRIFSLFIGTFLVSVVAIFTLASFMAPEVDVTIGDDVEVEEKNIGLGVRQFVDDRLRKIEMDDLGHTSLTSSTEEESISDTSDIEEEKIDLPINKVEKVEVKPKEEPEVKTSYEAPRPDKNEIVLQVEPKKTVYKVYVGKYENSIQATVAKELLLDSGMDVSPFVKNVSGVYTLQIGSFLEKTRADNIANDLTRNGFSARVVQE